MLPPLLGRPYGRTRPVRPGALLSPQQALRKRLDLQWTVGGQGPVTAGIPAPFHLHCNFTMSTRMVKLNAGPVVCGCLWMSRKS